MSRGRNTTRRNTHRASISRNHPPCYHCGEEINYSAHHLDPMSFQVDHLTPLAKAKPGQDLDTLDNCVPSHRACNREKSDKVLHPAGTTFVTERCWWDPVT